jgi:hypothetical protein
MKRTASVALVGLLSLIASSPTVIQQKKPDFSGRPGEFQILYGIKGL